MYPGGFHDTPVSRDGPDLVVSLRHGVSSEENMMHMELARKCCLGSGVVAQRAAEEDKSGLHIEHPSRFLNLAI